MTGLEEKRIFIKEIILIVLAGILIIGTLITTTIIVRKNRYNEAINNHPDFNWLEEDFNTLKEVLE